MFHMVRSSALFSLILLSLPTAVGGAPVSPSSPVQAQVVVVKPLTLEHVADMDFGALTVTTGGTATINPTTGQLSVAGGLLPVSGPVSPARFVGAASRLSIILIRVPSTPVTLRRQGGTETLQVTNFTLDGFPIRIVDNRAFAFAVGGRLTVPAGTVDGAYSGDINVTVEYF